MSQVWIGFGVQCANLFELPYQGATYKGTYSEGVALGYDGSGRWPDYLPMIRCQSCEHYIVKPGNP